MRVYWKWVIKSVPNLGLVAHVGFNSNPRQTRSNVEAWLIYFGIENVLAWLANKYTEALVFDCV